MSVSYGGDKITFDDGTSIASGLSHFRNRVINGAMEIDQRNAGAAATVNSGANFFAVDRWLGTGIVSAGVYTFGQSTSTPPSGFSNFLRTTVTTADSSLASTDFYAFAHRIEGFNIADLNWGTANAKTITLSFWVRSSLTGTFGGTLNGTTAASASYAYSYTINAANTWEQKTITVPGPTIGTFSSTNGIGIQLWFALGLGSNFTGSTNAWTASAIYGPSGATNVMATNGATFDITGVQLEVGSYATTFERRPYGTELQLCQRYYQVFGGAVGASGGTFLQTSIQLPVQMRASPTVAGTVLTATDTASNYTQSSFSWTNQTMTNKSIFGFFGNFSGMTQYRPLSVTDGSFNLSAEL